MTPPVSPATEPAALPVSLATVPSISPSTLARPVSPVVSLAAPTMYAQLATRSYTSSTTSVSSVASLDTTQPLLIVRKCVWLAVPLVSHVISKDVSLALPPFISTNKPVFQPVPLTLSEKL